MGNSRVNIDDINIDGIIIINAIRIIKITSFEIKLISKIIYTTISVYGEKYLNPLMELGKKCILDRNLDIATEIKEIIQANKIENEIQVYIKERNRSYIYLYYYHELDLSKVLPDRATSPLIELLQKRFENCTNNLLDKTTSLFIKLSDKPTSPLIELPPKEFKSCPNNSSELSDLSSLFTKLRNKKTPIFIELIPKEFKIYSKDLNDNPKNPNDIILGLISFIDLMSLLQIRSYLLKKEQRIYEPFFELFNEIQTKLKIKLDIADSALYSNFHKNNSILYPYLGQ